MGKPISQSVTEIVKCASSIELIADLALLELQKKSIEGHYGKTWLQPEPYGIVFSIQPWNFPYWQFFRMASCAWMAGNLVALKHADAVSGCATLIEEICNSTGEKLMVNLRIGHETAAQVIASPLVAMVTLTGSTRAGKEVGRVAGENLKKQVLELGGSDAYIVMADCDLESAVAACVQSRLVNSGQSCIAAKRFFVHESIYQEFRNLFLEVLKKAKVGNPLEIDTKIGPMAGQKFAQQLNEQIAKAKTLDAKFVLAQDPFESRACYAPIGILEFGTNLNAFQNEEIFGPIASLYQFQNVEDVVAAINDGPYGLGGGIFSKNLEAARAIGEKINVGTFTINTWVQSDARVPFGGRKESGLGYELGACGLNDFTQWKVIGQK